MRFVSCLVSLMLVLIIIPINSDAAAAEELSIGAVFGGQWAEANNSSVQTSQLTDLPAIVEDYTATWCTNCVDVEHALDDVAQQIPIQQYNFHRSIGETQDPFGTDVLDLRWESRYGQRIPPTVIFNGSQKQVGSVSNGETLQDDFTTLAQLDLGLGQGNSSFSWTGTGQNSGSVSWNLSIDSSQFGDSVVSVNLWVVEASAYFEDGTNGLEDYPFIVREIQSLGNSTSGTEQISLPDAFDGDDLSVHLIYQVINPIVDEDIAIQEPSTSNEKGLPAASLIATLAIVVAAVQLRESRPIKES
jgi:thiol-disulfide isomerase/thioredoxin